METKDDKEMNQLNNRISYLSDQLYVEKLEQDFKKSRIKIFNALCKFNRKNKILKRHSKSYKEFTKLGILNLHHHTYILSPLGKKFKAYYQNRLKKIPLVRFECIILNIITTIALILMAIMIITTVNGLYYSSRIPYSIFMISFALAVLTGSLAYGHTISLSKIESLNVNQLVQFFNYIHIPTKEIKHKIKIMKKYYKYEKIT